MIKLYTEKRNHRQFLKDKNMARNIKKLILDKIFANGQTTTAEISRLSGFTRAYINRFLGQLCDEGKTTRVGKANRARLSEIFRRYTDENYRFDKTVVAVKLYERGVEYVSRSQARRLLCGLKDFKRMTLGFKGVSTIG